VNFSSQDSWGRILKTAGGRGARVGAIPIWLSVGEGEGRRGKGQGRRAKDAYGGRPVGSVANFSAGEAWTHPARRRGKSKSACRGDPVGTPVRGKAKGKKAKGINAGEAWTHPARRRGKSKGAGVPAGRPYNR